MIQRELRALPAIPRETLGILAALAFVCVVLAALAGWGLARALRSPAPQAPGAPRTVTLGPASIEVPPTWHAISARRAGIPGVNPSARAFRIEDGLDQRAFITLAAPSDRWLIPSSLRHALRPPFGAPVPRLLAGYHAWWYSSIATTRHGVAMRLTVLPTTAGVLAVACTSAQVVDPNGCDQDIAQIVVSPAHAIRPTPDVAFGLAVSGAVARLQRDRAVLVRKLDAARDARAQARALQAIGQLYAAAARRFDPFGPGRPADVVAALRRTASAYGAAATAARGQAFGDYLAARAAVRSAESGLAKAFAQVG